MLVKAPRDDIGGGKLGTCSALEFRYLGTATWQ